MKTTPIHLAGLVQFTLLTALVITVACNPAYAQFSKANTVLTLIKNTLISVGQVICACALIWSGYKVMWQHAKWSEVSNVVLGAILVGGAAELSDLLMA